MRFKPSCAPSIQLRMIPHRYRGTPQSHQLRSRACRGISTFSPDLLKRGDAAAKRPTALAAEGHRMSYQGAGRSSQQLTRRSRHQRADGAAGGDEISPSCRTKSAVRRLTSFGDVWRREAVLASSSLTSFRVRTSLIMRRSLIASKRAKPAYPATSALGGV